MFVIRKNIFWVFILFSFLVHAQDSISPKEREIVDPINLGKEVHLYLLVGQSNMAGSSPIEPSDTIPNSRILRLNKNKEWDVAKEPIRVDKDIIGMGPGLSFGRELAKRDTTVIIGLIPAAVGGTSIDLWVPGAYDHKTKLNPYDQAIDRALFAMKSGELKGIIWNQGESDSHEGRSTDYQDKLKAVIERFRKDLSNENLPFVAGQLSRFRIVKKIDGKRKVDKHAQAVNLAMIELKKEVDNYDVVRLKSAEHKGDGTHLDSKSARALGKKYAHSMIMLSKQ